MKKFVRNRVFWCCLLIIGGLHSAYPADSHSENEGELDVRELILEHLADSYEWHVATIGDKHIAIPLLVIVKGEKNGWQLFSSSHFHHGASEYKGFYLATEGKYKGKVVERSVAGEETRPLDISITKNVFSLLFSSLLLVCIILFTASWYKKESKTSDYKAPKGFVALMELFIMSVTDDLIKPCVGKDYKRYVPYLLTVFFFIFFNNLLGLIPLFPGGANLTGNISVTFVLALFTFLIVNCFATKEYWREILWPEVPVWLKVPVPIMPALELVGIFTKPFALMIRLFANILAGHSIVLGLTCLIFVTVSLGSAVNSGMTVVSVLLTVFINFLELLVAYIQAYVFTMLSAVFIGLSRVEPHPHSKGHS
ncbi:MAG: F0F1 ATP synthase subunit A [Dysgonamonadaceae bacterium]|jgi:F-type H+-transporting ATPase subunit a|nr:F0F1 ATP synthase subunit A [Dysgonamonadaceae bacterium]